MTNNNYFNYYTDNNVSLLEQQAPTSKDPSKSLMDTLTDCCMSPDASIRQRSQQLLLASDTRQLVSQFLLQTIITTQTSSQSTSQRQMACTFFKNAFVPAHWLLLSPDTRTLIKSTLLNACLTTEHSKPVRVLQCACLVKLAHLDWPEEWLDLIPVLMQHLNAPAGIHVDAVLSILKDLVADDMQLPMLLQHLLPQLLALLNNTQQVDTDIYAQALDIYRESIILLATVSDVYPQAVSKYFSPLLHSLMHATGRLLLTTDQISLKCKCVKLVNVIADLFPKLFATFMQEWTQVTVQQLQPLSQMFTRASVLDSQEDFEILELLSAVQEYISLLTTRKSGLSALQPFITTIVETSIHLMQITQELEDQWSNDVDAYIAAEDLDSSSYNTRNTAQELITVMVDKFNASPIVDEHAQRLLMMNSHWQLSEACLCVLGLIRDNSPALDTVSLIQHIVSPLMVHPDTPILLKGRCLIFASQFQIESETRSQFYSYSVLCLQNPQEPVLIRVCAIVSLKTYFETQSTGVEHLQDSRILDGMCAAIQSVENDTLLMCMETLNSMLQVFPAHMIIERHDIIVQTCMNVWPKSCLDPILSSILLETFQILSKIHSVYSQVLSVFVPYAMQVLSEMNEGVEESLIRAATALEFLVGLVNDCSNDEILHALTRDVLPPVLHSLTQDSCVDESVLQSGQDFITCFIKRRVLEDHTHAERVFQFAVSVLSRELSDESLLMVGDLVGPLVSLSSLPRDAMFTLLKSVVDRLMSTSKAALVQTLLVVLLKWVYFNPLDAVEFLSSLSVLESVLRKWIDHVDILAGVNAQHVSSLAMTSLLSLNDARLQSVHVKGQVISRPELANVIMTRSRSKAQPEQWTSVSFTTKVFSLLLTEISSQNTLKETDIVSDDSDNQEWEEESGDADETMESTQLKSVLDDIQNDEEFKLDQWLLSDSILQVNRSDVVSQTLHRVVTDNLYGVRNELMSGASKIGDNGRLFLESLMQ